MNGDSTPATRARLSGDSEAAPDVPSRGIRFFSDLKKSIVTGTGALFVAALGISLLLREVLAVANADLILLVGVTLTALIYGAWPALAAAAISALAYNFLFLPPLYTFTIADPENVVAFAVFALVAVVTANLAARVRTAAVEAVRRNEETENLYRFSRKLAEAVQFEDILAVIAHQVARALAVRVVILLPFEDRLRVGAGSPSEETLGPADLAAAHWSWEHSRAAGREADLFPGAAWSFMPLATGRGKIGVIGMTADGTGGLLTADRRRLVEALCDQAAVAIERVNLAAEAERMRFSAESARLKDALLTSISHDLRTPLASILGAATTLRDSSGALSPSSREELTSVIQEEAERLNRLIANLLDMTKLKSGNLPVAASPIDVADVVGSALFRARSVVAHHRVQLDVDPELPMINGDPVMLEQVIFNLLDNAAKYAPAGTTIFIRATCAGDVVQMNIEDEGPGLARTDVERIFEKFYRARPKDASRPGTGLGLAVARGFVEAMGGRIDAQNRDGVQGASFRLAFNAVPSPLRAHALQSPMAD